MTTLNVTDARKNLYKLIDATHESHEPVLIKGKRNNGVLVSEEDWNSIQETLYLTSIPGMVESIKKGLKEDLEKSSKDLDW
jgi:antitoxin YefM